MDEEKLISLKELGERVEKMETIENEYYRVLMDVTSTSAGNFIRINISTRKYKRALFVATLKIDNEKDFEGFEEWISFISSEMIEHPIHKLDVEVTYDEVYVHLRDRTDIHWGDKFNCKSDVFYNKRGELEMVARVKFRETGLFHLKVHMWISTQNQLVKMDKLMEFLREKVATPSPSPSQV